jgi:hypothetical protein
MKSESAISGFAKTWLADFEFCQPDGEAPQVHCMVAREYRTKELILMWFDEPVECPFGEDDLIVAYYASAEVNCFLQLGWDVPKHILDLFVEFKNIQYGRAPTGGWGLLNACHHYGITTGISAEAKDGFRQMAQQRDFTAEETEELINYCQSDVDTTFKLLEKMEPEIDLPRALIRGKYMAAVAQMERTGIPMDTVTLGKLRQHWPSIKSDLIADVDADFGVFENGSFRVRRWSTYLNENRMAWPLLPSGELDLKDDTFRDMTKLYPWIQPIKELRATLGQLKLNNLAVGSDGRNRTSLGAFGSLTGRNTPSNTKLVFGPATWFRNLIKPAEGMAIAYIDWEQQEHGIAAALSGDLSMQEAYITGDPYLAFAKQAGAAPHDATKESHSQIRDLYKSTVLAVQYGMGAKSLGYRIGQTQEHAKALLNNHKRLYPRFWLWADQAEAQGMLNFPLTTVFGWRTLGREIANPRTFRNFPAQANGAEMLRIAVIALVESEIKVCAPVHDAVLIEAPIGQIEATVATARAIMEEASRVVLNGFTIKTDAKIIRYPERYSDPRGDQMWTKLLALIDEKDVGDTHIVECGHLPHAVWVPPTDVLSY